MMLFDLALVVAGYALSILTWSKVKVWVNGAEAEATSLKTRADALLATVKKA
jgi:hypothetical protein